MVSADAPYGRLFCWRPSSEVYEDTAGLTVGDPVVKTKKPLSLELGPGEAHDSNQQHGEGVQEMTTKIWNYLAEVDYHYGEVG